MATACDELKNCVSVINNEIIKKDDVITIVSKIEECCNSVKNSIASNKVGTREYGGENPDNTGQPQPKTVEDEGGEKDNTEQIQPET